MSDLTYIKGFFFHSAEYQLDDGAEDAVVLVIDYKNNSFAVKDKVGAKNIKFRQEIESLARSLLQRKHGVNRAGLIKK